MRSLGHQTVAEFYGCNRDTLESTQVSTMELHRGQVDMMDPKEGQVRHKPLLLSSHWRPCFFGSPGVLVRTYLSVPGGK